MIQELYEPLWEEIYQRSKVLNFRIRSIWTADVSHQGRSGIVNDHNLGNDRKCFHFGLAQVMQSP